MKKLLLFYVFVFSVAQAAYTQCNHPDDYTALRALYLSTDGDNWTDNTGWLDAATFTANPTPPVGTDMSAWFGVTCDGAVRVQNIQLSNNNLAGLLPIELGNLNSLKQFNTSINMLTGSIPPELGSLPNLERLEIIINSLSGSIPAELGNLPNLKHLNLAVNNLTGNIPDELGNITTLESLFLNRNPLTGCIPSTFRNLTNLVAIHIDFTSLSGSIPPWLDDLPNLVQIYATDSDFSGCFPQNLSNLCGEDIHFERNPNLPNSGDFTAFCNTGSGQCALELAIKTYLQGPLDISTGLMDDDLRQAGLLPTSFGGSNITSPDIFSTTGDNAIVDWVTVELHSTFSPTTIALSRPALLQRDGDVVDVDGKRPLNFDTLPADTYHIVVKHRNHLGIMSNMTVTVN